MTRFPLCRRLGWMQVASPSKHSPQQHHWLVHSKGVLLASRSSGFWWTVLSLSSGLLLTIASEGCKCFTGSVFTVQSTHRSTLVNYSFTRISRFIFSPTTSGHWPRVSAHCCCGDPPSFGILEGTCADVPRESIQKSPGALFGSHLYNHQTGRVCQ